MRHLSSDMGGGAFALIAWCFTHHHPQSTSFQAMPRRFSMPIAWLCVSASTVGCIMLGAGMASAHKGQLRSSAAQIDEKASVSQMPDLFCFAVMGMPAHEQNLLLAQQSKGKGRDIRKLQLLSF